MISAHSIAAALVLTFTIPFATAQQPDWNMVGSQKVNASITTLPTNDQQAIEHALTQPRANLHAKRIDTPSAHFFLIQGSGTPLCDQYENCASWILSSDYNILLKATASALKLQPSLQAGFPDILTSIGGWHDQGYLTQCRFDGAAYHPSACASYTYHDSFNDTFARPRITPQPCVSR
jgi:hypothetical protein